MAEMTPPEPPEEPVGEALPPPEPPKAPEQPPLPPAASPEAIIGGGCAGLIVASLLGLFNLTIVLTAFGEGSSSPRNGCGTATIVAGIIETVIVVGLSVLAWWLLFKVRRTGKNTDFFRAMAVVAAVFFLVPWPCGASLPAYAAFSSCHR